LVQGQGTPDCDRAAALALVRFIFYDRSGRRGQAVVPWVSGKTLHTYLKERPLSSVHLMGRRLTARVVNQRFERLRMGSVLRAGDTVTFKQMRSTGDGL
jgi:hypothetical protein